MRFLLHLKVIPLLVLAISVGCNRGVERLDYSVEKLTKTLKDKDPNMRYWAAQSLGNYGPKAYVAIPNIAEALRDENSMVRMGAAYALAEIGPAAEQVRPALEAALKDPEKDVREAAQYALKRVAAKASSPPAKR